MKSGRADRLGRRFEELRREGRTGLIPFLTAGDRSLGFTEKALLMLDRPGVAAIEIGVPFSDPLADGPTIQRSSERALAAGTTLAGVLGMIGKVREKISAPIVLMSYMNPMLRFGLERFAERAAKAGVDGLIATDLPVEEAGPLGKVLAAKGIGSVFLAAPTSPPARVRKIAAACTGFLYYVSLTGVTGARTSLPKDLGKRLAGVRRITSRPLAVGFGVSEPAQVKALAPHCDAVVVGSVLVQTVEAEKSDKARLAALDRKVASLLAPLTTGSGKK